MLFDLKELHFLKYIYEITYLITYYPFSPSIFYFYVSYYHISLYLIIDFIFDITKIETLSF